MEMTLAEHLAEAVRKEGQRNRYPDNFPHMPKIPAGRYRAALFHQLEMNTYGKRCGYLQVTQATSVNPANILYLRSSMRR